LGDDAAVFEADNLGIEQQSFIYIMRNRENR
jgi:hypothetical protein